MTAPILPQILKDMGSDPGAWGGAGTREQVMVILGWGRDHGRNFGCGELCGLLGLPEDVVQTVLYGLADDGLVPEANP